MAAKKIPSGSIKLVSAVARTSPNNCFDYWQLAPLWVLLVSLIVNRIFFVSHHCPHGLGKTSKEKLGSCLNLTGTPHVAVPYALFIELQLLVVVVGLPRLSPPSLQTCQDIKREVAQLLELTETPHVAVGPVLLC
jgi:hypothetical protein